MTNGDVIRGMADWELAELLASITDCCFYAGQRSERTCGGEVCDKFCPLYKCCHNQPSDNIEEWIGKEHEENDFGAFF